MIEIGFDAWHNDFAGGCNIAEVDEVLGTLRRLPSSARWAFLKRHRLVDHVCTQCWVLYAPIRETVGADLLGTYWNNIEHFRTVLLQRPEAERRVRRDRVVIGDPGRDLLQHRRGRAPISPAHILAFEHVHVRLRHPV